MITYSKHYWGLHLLSRVYGSAVPRSFLFVGLSVLLTAVLHIWANDYTQNLFHLPHAINSLSFIVGFAVVFRTNFGYGRYWEGRTTLAQMSARWADFATQAITQDRSSGPGSPMPTDHGEFVQQLCHLTSLLHALALQHLRGDWELANLVPHQPAMGPPPVDAAALPVSRHFHPIDYFMLRGSKEHLETYNRSTPLGVIGSLSPEENEGLGRVLEKLGSVTVETALTGQDVEGGSCCVRLMQLSTGTYVPGASERVQVVFAWLHDLIHWRMKSGGLNVPSPIATRMIQMMSEGFNAFEQARKIADTPFPFPWAQLLLVMLILFSIVLPFWIVSTVSRLWMAMLMDGATILCFWSLNEVVRDLEDPFYGDPNDLPFARHQYQFNERLLSIVLSPGHRGFTVPADAMPDIQQQRDDEAPKQAAPMVSQPREGKEDSCKLCRQGSDAHSMPSAPLWSMESMPGITAPPAMCTVSVDRRLSLDDTLLTNLRTRKSI